MSDESGGDFGGGSVKWRITTGNESQDPSDKVRDRPEAAGGVPKTVNAGRDRDDDIDENFCVRLKVPSQDRDAITASLQDALNILANGGNQIEIELPRRPEPKQIQVIWRKHPPSSTTSPSTRSTTSTSQSTPSTR